MNSSERNRLQREHRERVRRLYDGVTRDREFWATAVADKGGFPFVPERYRSNANKPSDNQYTAVFYADGSRKEGCLSAAVAWDPSPYPAFQNWKTESIPLGRNVGESNDAELHAILLALQIAQQHRAEGHNIGNVVVFSDCQTVIKMLDDDYQGSQFTGTIGVLQDSGRWSLEELYNVADDLKRAQVPVTIRWVLGHSGYVGNQTADTAARAANDRQIALLGGLDRNLPLGQVSVPYAVFGEDTRKEYLYRASAPFLRDGKGMCHLTGRVNIPWVPPPPPGPPPPTIPVPPPPLTLDQEADKFMAGLRGDPIPLHVAWKR